MELVVNGKRMQVSDGLTASGLLQQLGVQPERVVVEVNVTVLKRDRLASTVLNAGDQVEIVHFVGGGASQAACHRLQAALRACSLKLEA
ncbi:MAG: sulfur carrier protein ThiS [Candidatus Omnitrophica bacterium]|nr:sulfur carrier protein ThiS [Candidatus Omnitrophota bacterium]